MNIRLDNLEGAEICTLLQRHLDEVAKHSPPEGVHALDLAGLQMPEISFWTLWQDENLLGCGALKELDTRHGEIKSMHTHSNARGMGVAKTMLNHIMTTARQRGYERLSLETGSMAAFAPARKLYEKHGFVECPVFGDYKVDVHSVFMTKAF